MIDKTSIGQIIKTLRKQKKYTQDELSEMIDISPNHLSKVERGLSLPNVETFLKMAQILGFSLRDFGILGEVKDDLLKNELINRILYANPSQITNYAKALDFIDEIVK